MECVEKGLVRHLRLGLGGTGWALSTSHRRTFWASKPRAPGSRSRGWRMQGWVAAPA